MVSDGQYESELEGAIQRIRRYETRHLNKDTFKDVKSQSDLANWISKVTKTDNEELARQSIRTPEVRAAIENNVRQEKEEIQIREKIRQPVFTNKNEARKNKGIFVGTYKVKRKGKKSITRTYAFDYKLKKQIKVKKAV